MAAAEDKNKPPPAYQIRRVCSKTVGNPAPTHQETKAPPPRTCGSHDNSHRIIDPSIHPSIHPCPTPRSALDRCHQRPAAPSVERNRSADRSIRDILCCSVPSLTLRPHPYRETERDRGGKISRINRHPHSFSPFDRQPDGPCKGSPFSPQTHTHNSSKSYYFLTFCPPNKRKERLGLERQTERERVNDAHLLFRPILRLQGQPISSQSIGKFLKFKDKPLVAHFKFLIPLKTQ